MVDKREHVMVAALDFGTTYSGYAFSMLCCFVIVFDAYSLKKIA
jgi:hypothetical protein